MNLILAETPRAFLKVEYDEIVIYPKEKETDITNHFEKFILLIANGKSQYYNYQTFYIDSLENDPTGKSALDALWKQAYEEMMISKTEPYKYMKDRGFVGESRYRSEKDFDKGIITVKDSNMGNKYRYPVEMSDLLWQIGDSTKNILGYDCINAKADYHGRQWLAWFAPDIPVQDGPWQLCGLPGLIMEAETIDNIKKYAFKITGIQKTDEEFKPDFIENKYYNTKRKSFLKMKDYSRRNRAAQIGAMTGGTVKLSEKVNYKGEIDYIEIDLDE